MNQLSTATDTLTAASLDWHSGPAPRSTRYGDVYYSAVDGLQESRTVFLSHNRLRQRWLHPHCDRAHFIIIETGFGTGLNFLAAWQLWRACRRDGRQLHYVSLEKHPLSAADISRAARPWPELKALCDTLCRHYPPTLPGLHPLQLEDGLQLTLGFGDAGELLDQLCDCAHPALRAATSISADAWFLDGFAPAKNPSMWTERLFARMAALSRPGTSFATFTAAGMVRRGLADAGFRVGKVPGFGSKRDMLCGSLKTAAAGARLNTAETVSGKRGDRPPLAWHTTVHRTPETRTALIIGAGLAGCHTASALARSGWQVTVVDRAAACAAAASGNPSGLLYSRLSAHPAPASDFALASYLYACRHYRALFDRRALASGVDGALRGLLRLGHDPRELRQIEALGQRYRAHPELLRLLSADDASRIGGVEIPVPALLMPGSGWLSPRAVCRELLNHPDIRLLTDCDIASIDFQRGRWQAHHAGAKALNASVCIVCSGIDSQVFPALSWLPVRPVAGQITLLEAPGDAPQLPLCHDGYVLRQGDGRWCCGASFRVNTAAADIRDDEHRHTLRTLSRRLPGLLPPERLATLTARALQGRAAVRCATPDYLPVVGPAPDIAALSQAFAALRWDARSDIPVPGPVLPGLFINTGHGSKGLATTPIAAEVIAAQLNGTPRPLPWRLMQALSPARFPVRTLMKGQRPC